MHSYLISGLHVCSELDCRARSPKPSRLWRRTFRSAAVRCRWCWARAGTGPTWEMTSEIFLLRVPRLARFLITAGRDINVQTEPGISDHEVAGFVLGSAFGILLHQRGALVLHGAAVAKDGRAIAICGASGAGKSTLAAALCHSGCTLVTDDICVVGEDVNQRPIVFPDGRQLKLWKESIDRLDLAELRGKAVREPFEKYNIRFTPCPRATVAAFSDLCAARIAVAAQIGNRTPDAARRPADA